MSRGVRSVSDDTPGIQVPIIRIPEGCQHEGDGDGRWLFARPASSLNFGLIAAKAAALFGARRSRNHSDPKAPQIIPL
jgi:hypothetical protein